MRRRIYDECYGLYNQIFKCFRALGTVCEQLMMAVSKLGWRVHWGVDIVGQATFPRGKADASYLKGLI